MNDVISAKELLETHKDNRVEADIVNDKYFVSTVSLSMFMFFYDKELYETEVFKIKDGFVDFDGIRTERTNTLKEAIETHKKIVKEYSKK